MPPERELKLLLHESAEDLCAVSLAGSVVSIAAGDDDEADVVCVSLFEHDVGLVRAGEPSAGMVLAVTETPEDALLITVVSPSWVAVQPAGRSAAIAIPDTERTHAAAAAIIIFFIISSFNMNNAECRLNPRNPA